MAVNLYIDLSDAYRLFATPGRTAGAMCLRCGDGGGPPGFIPTDSLTVVLRWIEHHDATAHQGVNLTPAARAAHS